MSVHVVTLGELRVLRDLDELPAMPGQRVRCALLVHLAVEKKVSRDQLMGLLWPDRPPDRARHSLSQTVYELRKDLGDDWLEVQGDVLRATDALGTDVDTFREAADAGDDRGAMDAYAGQFLEGANLSTSRAYEGWIDQVRTRLAREHRLVATRLVRDLRDAGDPEEALATARAWVERDPLDDEAQHALIDLLAHVGRRSAALRQYERYADLLARELDVEPLDETRALIEEIRSEGGRGDVGVGTAAAAKVGSRPPVETPVAAATRPDASTDASPAPASRDPAVAPPSPEAQDDPPPPPDTPLAAFIAFADELRRRRVNRVALAYVVMAFAFLEGADLLLGGFGVPSWVSPTLAVLVVLGFPVVLVLAWVFDVTPQGLEVTRPIGSGSAAVTAFARRGLLGLVTVSVVGLGAVWAWRKTVDAPVFDTNRVMVFPLVTPESGSALQASLGEDVATMIGHALDRTASLRWIDGWSLLPPAERNDVRQLTNEEARSLAASRNCRYIVRGRVVERGDSAQVLLELWDAAGDSTLALADHSGPVDQAWQTGLAAVGLFLPRLIGTEVPRFGQEIFSPNPAAVASFLLGERSFRRGRAEEALTHYSAAVTADPAFALAAIRGAEAASWAHDHDAGRGLLDLALGLDLKETERHFAVGMRAYIDGLGDSAAAAFDRSIAADSGNVLAWTEKGEVFYHLAPRTRRPDSVGMHAFLKARALDPQAVVNTTFHLLESALTSGDRAAAQPLLQEFLAQDPEESLRAKVELEDRCARGDLGRAAWREAIADNPDEAARDALEAAKQFAIRARNPVCAEDGFRAVLLAPVGPSDGEREAAFLGLQGLLYNQGRHAELVATLDAATRGLEALQDLLERSSPPDGVGPDGNPGADDSFGVYLDAAELGVLGRRAQSLSLVWTARGLDLGDRPERVAERLRARWGPGYADAPAFNVGLWRLLIYEASKARVDRLSGIVDAMEQRAADGDPTSMLFAEAGRAHRALALGDTADALRRFGSLRTVGPRSFLDWTLPEPLGFERVTEARLWLAQGTAEGAQRAYDLASSLDGSALGFTPYLVDGLVIRIEAAEALGLATHAEELRRRLARTRGEAGVEPPP